MKRLKNGIRILAATCAALGWWGLLFPGLTLTPDTVRVVCEEEGKEAFPEHLYLELLETEAFSWDKSTEN